MTTYGYIGLGMMGSAMAGHLASTGTNLFVHDLDPAPVETLVNAGATAAASAAEVAERCDVVSICVPAAHHIEGVLEAMAGSGRAGQTILIHSTVHPDTIGAAADTAAAWGARVFDVCVAGGAEAAAKGELAIFVGGLGEMADGARNLLDIYSSKVIDAGPLGSGAALKIAVNVMTYAQFAAAATSHDLVTGYGADPAALLDAWRHIGMLGALTESFAGMLDVPPEHVTGEFAATMRTQVGIAEKDLQLALELGGGSELVASIRSLMPAVYRTGPMP